MDPHFNEFCLLIGLFTPIDMENPIRYDPGAIIPEFAPGQLEKMTVAQLTEVCKTYNIRKGSKKAEYVSNIRVRVQHLREHIDVQATLERNLQSCSFSTDPPVNDFYRNFFNLVDLSDRRWYSVEEHHPIHQWKTKMLFAILRNAMLNVWTRAYLDCYSCWIDFREFLALRLFAQKPNRSSRAK